MVIHSNRLLPLAGVIPSRVQDTVGETPTKGKV